LIKKVVTNVGLIAETLRHACVMQFHRPLNAGRMDEEFLAKVLGIRDSQLGGMEWQLLHEGTTSRWRLALQNPPGSLPSQLFAKTNPPDFTTRLFGALFQLGPNELGFYRDIRNELPINTPRCFGVYGNLYRYLILIEDLSARARFTDVSSRCDLQMAEAVIDTLASLHARCWQDERLNTDWRWVNRQEYGRAHSFLTLLRNIATKQALKRYRDLLPENIPALARKLNEKYIALEQLWSQGERTLVHGDAHIGNMYFLDDGSSGLLDWQVLGVHHAMRDVTYFLINSLPTALRQEHEELLIERYINRLDEKNIQLAKSKAWQQYHLHAPYVWIASAVTAASDTMQDEKIAAAGLLRSSQALIDLEMDRYLDTI